MSLELNKNLYNFNASNQGAIGKKNDEQNKEQLISAEKAGGDKKVLSNLPDILRRISNNEIPLEEAIMQLADMGCSNFCAVTNWKTTDLTFIDGAGKIYNISSNSKDFALAADTLTQEARKKGLLKTGNFDDLFGIKTKKLVTDKNNVDDAAGTSAAGKTDSASGPSHLPVAPNSSNITYTTFDNQNRPLTGTATDAQGNVLNVTVSYTPNDSMITYTDNSGNITKMEEYDASGNLTLTVNYTISNGKRTGGTAVDGNGNTYSINITNNTMIGSVEEIKDSNNRVVRKIERYQNGNVRAITDITYPAGGGRVETMYDFDTNHTQIKTYNSTTGGTNTSTTNVTYFDDGTRLEETISNGQTTTVRYDASGNQIAQTASAFSSQDVSDIVSDLSSAINRCPQIRTTQGYYVQFDVTNSNSYVMFLNNVLGYTRNSTDPDALDSVDLKNGDANGNAIVKVSIDTTTALADAVITKLAAQLNGDTQKATDMWTALVKYLGDYYYNETLNCYDRSGYHQNNELSDLLFASSHNGTLSSSNIAQKLCDMLDTLVQHDSATSSQTTLGLSNVDSYTSFLFIHNRNDEYEGFKDRYTNARGNSSKVEVDAYGNPVKCMDGEISHNFQAFSILKHSGLMDSLFAQYQTLIPSGCITQEEFNRIVEMSAAQAAADMNNFIAQDTCMEASGLTSFGNIHGNNWSLYGQTYIVNPEKLIQSFLNDLNAQINDINTNGGINADGVITYEEYQRIENYIYASPEWNTSMCGQTNTWTPGTRNGTQHKQWSYYGHTSCGGYCHGWEDHNHGDADAVVEVREDAANILFGIREYVALYWNVAEPTNQTPDPYVQYINQHVNNLNYTNGTVQGDSNYAGLLPTVRQCYSGDDNKHFTIDPSFLADVILPHLNEELTVVELNFGGDVGFDSPKDPSLDRMMDYAYDAILDIKGSYELQFNPSIIPDELYKLAALEAVSDTSLYGQQGTLWGCDTTQLAANFKDILERMMNEYKINGNIDINNCNYLQNTGDIMGQLLRYSEGSYDENPVTNVNWGAETEWVNHVENDCKETFRFLLQSLAQTDPANYTYDANTFDEQFKVASQLAVFFVTVDATNLTYTTGQSGSSPELGDDLVIIFNNMQYDTANDRYYYEINGDTYYISREYELDGTEHYSVKMESKDSRGQIVNEYIMQFDGVKSYEHSIQGGTETEVHRYLPIEDENGNYIDAYTNTLIKYDNNGNMIIEEGVTETSTTSEKWTIIENDNGTVKNDIWSDGTQTVTTTEVNGTMTKRVVDDGNGTVETTTYNDNITTTVTEVNGTKTQKVVDYGNGTVETTTYNGPITTTVTEVNGVKTIEVVEDKAKNKTTTTKYKNGKRDTVTEVTPGKTVVTDYSPDVSAFASQPKIAQLVAYSVTTTDSKGNTTTKYYDKNGNEITPPNIGGQKPFNPGGGPVKPPVIPPVIPGKGGGKVIPGLINPTTPPISGGILNPSKKLK